MRAETTAQSDSSMGSPFDLPEESQAINNEAEEATIEDKMQAIREASLTTYVMLSLIYIAIQDQHLACQQIPLCRAPIPKQPGV